MHLTLTMFLIVCPFVGLAGFVDSIAGGGGLISLPAYLLAGLPAHSAIATNKISSFLGTSASLARYIQKGFVQARLALPSAALAVCGALLGARLILCVDDRIVQYMLLLVLPVAAVLMLRSRELEPADPDSVSPRKRFALVLVFTLLIGVYDGFYGPGTGTFLLLAYTRLAKMDVRSASGNMKVANWSSNLGSLAVFLTRGQAVVLLGLTAAVFNILGNLLGSSLVIKNGSRIVRPIILTVLALLFCKVAAGFLT